MRGAELWPIIVDAKQYSPSESNWCSTAPWDDEGRHSIQFLNSVFENARLTHKPKAFDCRKARIRFSGHIFDIILSPSNPGSAGMDGTGGLLISIWSVGGDISKAEKVAMHIANYLEQFRGDMTKNVNRGVASEDSKKDKSRMEKSLPHQITQLGKYISQVFR